MADNACAGPDAGYDGRRKHKVSDGAVSPRGVVGDGHLPSRVLRPDKGRFGAKASQAAAIGRPAGKARPLILTGAVAAAVAALAAKPVAVKVGSAALGSAKPVSPAAGGGLLAAAALLSALTEAQPVVGALAYALLAAPVAPPPPARADVVATAARAGAPAVV